ncbi:ubiquinol-cytochrome c reductase iron-sulfur subunit [Desulfosediminicola sp.]|uniref:QcrA and Rieske domain-containing protein n=1 Tax=Desulfosediminicola sp. TaxID=2886825 RepID=UPI003AF1E6C0
MSKRQGAEAATGEVAGRRKFLNRIWTFLVALACLEFGWLSVRLVRSAGQKRIEAGKADLIRVGRVEDFSPNTVTAIPQGQFYLVCLEGEDFRALSRLCTHLGCATLWDQETERFVCPCHGSSFDITGKVLTPPALKGLSSHPLRIENGEILVNRAISVPAPSAEPAASNGTVRG